MAGLAGMAGGAAQASPYGAAFNAAAGLATGGPTSATTGDQKATNGFSGPVINYGTSGSNTTIIIIAVVVVLGLVIWKK